MTLFSLRHRGGDVFLDFPTGRRTPLWRSAARSSATGPWTCTSNTSAAPRTWIGYNVLDSPMRDEWHGIGGRRWPARSIPATTTRRSNGRSCSCTRAASHPGRSAVVARHPQDHRAGLLQRQSRGVRQQDQGHHPHGLRLPPRRQPHRPDHAPMRWTRHPTTTTHDLTHESSRSL